LKQRMLDGGLWMADVANEIQHPPFAIRHPT
jgi:hypothetical protein